MDKNRIDYHGTLVHKTPKAILFKIDGRNEMWFPESCVEYEKPNKHGQTTIEMSKYYAEKRGLL